MLSSSIFFGRAVHLPLKYFPKIAAGTKAAFPGDFHNLIGCIFQQTARRLYPVFLQIGKRRNTKPFLKTTQTFPFAYMRRIGNLFQRNRIPIEFLHI